MGALALRWRQRRWRIAEGNAGIGARESGLKKETGKGGKSGGRATCTFHGV